MASHLQLSGIDVLSEAMKSMRSDGRNRKERECIDPKSVPNRQATQMDSLDSSEPCLLVKKPMNPTRTSPRLIGDVSQNVLCSHFIFLDGLSVEYRIEFFEHGEFRVLVRARFVRVVIDQYGHAPCPP